MSCYVPEYLPPNLSEKFSRMAADLRCVGYSDVDAPLLAKYLIAENEWQRATNHVTTALNRGDADSAAKWIGAQDKLVGQIMKLGNALNMSPEARASRGVPYPGTRKNRGGVALEQGKRLQSPAQ